MKKILLLLVLSVFYTVQLKGQLSIQYTISAEYGKENQQLDSIVFENLTNQKRVVVGGLPLTTSTYMVNLSNVNSGSNDIRSSKQDFRLTQVMPGVYSVQYLGMYQLETRIVVYNIAGHLCQSQQLNFEPGASTQISIGLNGIYFISLQTSDGLSSSFKVIGKNGSGNVQISYANHSMITAQKYQKEHVQRLPQDTIEENIIKANLEFSLGDSLQIHVYKYEFVAEPTKIEILDDEILLYNLTFVPVMPETVINSNVYTWEPATDTPENEIIEYTPNSLHIRLTGGSSGQGVLRRPQFVNFNTKNYNNIQVGDIVCVAPNVMIPLGTIIQATEVQYGEGSVMIYGTKPLIEDVADELGVSEKINLFKYINDGKFEFEPVKDVVTLEMENKDGVVWLNAKFSFDLLNNLIETRPTKDQEQKFKAFGNAEFSVGIDNYLVFEMRKKKDEKIDFIKTGIEGNLKTKVNGEFGFKYDGTKTYWSKDFHTGFSDDDVAVFQKVDLGRFKLVPIPLGTTPFFIQPTIVLSLEVKVSGEIKIVGTILNTSHNYMYGIEYMRDREESWQLLKIFEKQKNEDPDFSVEGKVKLELPLELGYEIRFMHYSDAELELGVGVKHVAEFKTIYNPFYNPFENEKPLESSFKIDGSAFIYGSAKLEVLKLKVFNKSFEYNIYDWKIFELKDLSEGTWAANIPNSLKIVKDKSESISFEAPYDYEFTIRMLENDTEVVSFVKSEVNSGFSTNKKVMINFFGKNIGSSVLEIKSNKKELMHYILLNVVETNTDADFDDIPGELI